MNSAKKIMKSLTSQAVIPLDLYVERKADRQLALILSQMGRPGYVLVARQMGKTNLLLRAKRTLRQDGDIFAYLDVSNPFPNARGFFRNLVDVILDAAHDDMREVAARIAVRRQTSDALPHKEHEWELREVLRAINGKLVIFLDEIDALTAASFSDTVFSFIRSVYFSGRDNWEEFSRLTYVLSGVAEPSEIIKNKAISPFNIGERIFLDDFSRVEFESLLKMANLPFSKEVEERIFYWTNGNPRITWDLCSTLEDSCLDGIKATQVIVDAAVKRLYFGSVGLPPIDHIKQLVRENRDIRDCIISLHYGKSEVPDRLRTRLYLAGISSFNAETRTVAIKNRIIEEALSEEYLLAVAEPEQTPFQEATALYEAGQFERAVEGFSQLIDVTSVDGSQDVILYRAGLSSFKAGNSNRALQYFGQITAQLAPRDEVNRLYYSAIAHVDGHAFDKAIAVYRRIVAYYSFADYPYIVADAAVQLCIVLSESGQNRNTEIEQLSRGVIENRAIILEHIEDKGDARNIFYSAYLCLSRFYEATGKSAEAFMTATAAEEWADGIGIIDALMIQYRNARVSKHKGIVLERCLELIFLEGTTFDAEDVPLRTWFYVLESLDDMKRRADIRHVVACLTASYENSSQVEDFAIALVSVGVVIAGKQRLTRDVISAILETTGATLSLPIRRHLTALPLLFDQTTGGPEYEARIVDFFDKEDALFPIDNEFMILHKVIESDLLRRQFDRARHVVGIIKRAARSEIHKTDHRTRTSIDFLIRFHETMISLSEGAPADPGSLRYLLDTSNHVGSFSLLLFASDFARKARQAIQRELLRTTVKPIRTGSKIGRNDLITVSYSDGTKTGKYKHFASDLADGRCSIINN